MDTETPTPTGNMSFLTKRIAGQPTWIWLGGIGGGIALGLYLRARHGTTTTGVDTAPVDKGSDLAPTDGESLPTASDSSYSNEGSAGGTTLNVPTGSTVTTDPTTGAATVTVPSAAKDTTTVIPTTDPAVDTGGGIVQPPVIKLPPISAGVVVVAGKAFNGATSSQQAGHGKNSKGSYTTWKIIYPWGSRLYNHYTDNSWAGPF